MSSPSLYIILILGFSALHGSHTYSITELNDDNWQITLFDNWMILFCSSWHPACTYFKPEWIAFARWADDYNTRIAFVNFTKTPGLAARFLITKLPAVVHASNGVYRELDGEIATLKYRDLIKYVDFERRWTKFQEFPQYRRPNTWWMSIFADLVHYSMGMPVIDIHRFLVRKYFLPFSLYYFMMPIYYLILTIFYYVFVRVFLSITDVFSTNSHSNHIILPSKISRPRTRFESIDNVASGSSLFISNASFESMLNPNNSVESLVSKGVKTRKKDGSLMGYSGRSRKSASFSDTNSDTEKGKRHVDECFSDSDDHEPRRKSKANPSDLSSRSSRDNSTEDQGNKSSRFLKFDSSNSTIDSSKFVFL